MDEKSSSSSSSSSIILRPGHMIVTIRSTNIGRAGRASRGGS